jgi:serine/threonine protein kinase
MVGINDAGEGDMDGHTMSVVDVQPFSSAADPDAGALLAGRYRLAELVGRGGTARVWRAHDELLDRDVAVKQVAPHAHALIEARLAARVRHPHVAVVHDVVEHYGSSWLVMDYHSGPSLADVLRDGRRRLSPSAAAALGLQLIAALRAVHAAGVVHCDVKPANLVLGEDGRLVLVDFGIAETIDGDTRHPARRAGHVVGSPAFMAPEFVRGEAPQPAADLWSFGATLYTAVEGRPPFPHAEAVPTLTAVLHDAPQPTRRAARLQPLLALLLDKDAARRPSHDTIETLLAEAYPSRPALAHTIWGSATGRRAARSAAASRPAASPTGTLPSPHIPGAAALDTIDAAA